MNIYYLGLREKTVKHTTFFKDKILIKSSIETNFPCYEKILGHECDYNLIENFVPISNFYDYMIEKVCAIDPNALFMPYNQLTIQHIKNKDKIICVNDLDLIKTLNNKPKTREIFKGIVSQLDYIYLEGKDVSFEKINALFKAKSNKYVVQEFTGFGGIGTFVLSKESESKILQKLNKTHFYSISKYVENNIPINNTFIITKNKILIFDGTIQNILLENELLYDGWDSEKYEKLNSNLKVSIYNQTYGIAKKLQELGYIGIGGVDYIIENDKIYFMEINPRFQTSSEGLDKKLQEQGLPSIFELQYMSFYDISQFEYFYNKIKSQGN